jgi:hypothetical protein
MDSGRVARAPHSDVLFEGQYSALARIYALALHRYQENKGSSSPTAASTTRSLHIRKGGQRDLKQRTQSVGEKV